MDCLGDGVILLVDVGVLERAVLIVERGVVLVVVFRGVLFVKELL